MKKEQPPLFIRYLKILFSLGILLSLFMIFWNLGDLGAVVEWIMELLIFIILLLGITWRRRWSWYAGVGYFTLSILGVVFGRWTPLFYLSAANLVFLIFQRKYLSY